MLATVIHYNCGMVRCYVATLGTSLIWDLSGPNSLLSLNQVIFTIQHLILSEFRKYS